MRVMKRVIAVAVVLMAATVRLSAQGHPSFAGTWVMDPAKTVIDGQASAPSAGTRVVVQRGDTLIVDNEITAPESGTQKTHLVWGTDGKPWKNKVPIQGEETEVASVLTWDGPALVIKTAISFQGMSVEQADRWALSADGKSMTATRSLTVEGEVVGSATLTYVKKS